MQVILVDQIRVYCSAPVVVKSGWPIKKQLSVYLTGITVMRYLLQMVFLFKVRE